MVLTFHVGLAVRIASRTEVPIKQQAAELLPGAWRRWEQAVEALNSAREAEDYQAIGMRLRECLISFIGEIASRALVPEGAGAPKAADVKAWVNLLADHIAAGSSASKLRSYLKSMGEETWNYVNWLTHAKNAGHWDAEIGTAITSHLMATVTATLLRLHHAAKHMRCAECDSYAVVAGECQSCGWMDPDYDSPEPPSPLTDAELAARLAEPCTLSSDISTFISPDDYRTRLGSRSTRTDGGTSEG